MADERPQVDALRAIAERLWDGLLANSETDGHGEEANVVDGLFAIARALSSGFKWLGNADAATPMGALEAHGAVIKEAGEHVAGSLESIAEALTELAEQTGYISIALGQVAKALTPVDGGPGEAEG